MYYKAIDITGAGIIDGYLIVRQSGKIWGNPCSDGSIRVKKSTVRRNRCRFTNDILLIVGGAVIPKTAETATELVYMP